MAASQRRDGPDAHRHACGYTQQYRRCGKPSCPLCAAGSRGHGPYWYAYWREDGRARSRYMGKQRPPGAAPDGEAAPPCDRATPLPPPNAPDWGPQPPAVVVPVVRPHVEACASAIPAPPPLRACTLGGFALWRDGVPLATGRWERTKAGALLKWLLGAPGHRLSRDEVAERFWPEGTPERGMANLRVLVHRLRGALGDARGGEGGCLRYNGEVLTLRPGTASEGGWLDADAFALAAQAALARQDAAGCRVALALYAGDYLPGDAYAEWAVGRREELSQQRLAVLLRLAALCTGSGEAEEAGRCLGSVLAAEPCHEEAAMALMRLHAAEGRPGQALRVYRRFAEALREDLALEPEAPMQALARALAARQPAAPAIALPDLVRNNLPAPLTSFIGRRRELANLRALLQPAYATGAATAGDGAPTCRLLTLTGPGGAGKTRMALQLADDLLDQPGSYPDGVWLVELAGLIDPTLVPATVALALGIREETTRPLAETLAAHLAPKRLLLLIDNCEHLLDACAALAAVLLPACSGLQVLATSRAALGVAGERPWPVPALSLPEAEETTAGGLLEAEAARLFLDRARIHRPDLAVSGANAAAVARICRQLEGMPLALELAAARVSVLGLSQIADRLCESFGLLTDGPRTAPRRQRTLRATLDWSYELLTEPEQALLRRLAVFAGGCTLEAAEAVCAGERIVAEELLNLLGGLVRHSLVQMEDGAGAARYRLLETVRQYGRERQAEAGEQATLGRRHAAWCVALAEEAEPALTGAEQAEWLARLEREHDNLRAALHWARQNSPPSGTNDQALETGLRLVGALRRFWHTRGHLTEGRRWLATLLALPCPATSPAWAAQAKALLGAGLLAYYQGDLEQAAARNAESLARYREQGDAQGCAQALHGLGNALLGQGDIDRAADLYTQSLELRRAEGDAWGISSLLNSLGVLEENRSAFERATALFEESLTLKRQLRDTHGVAVILHNLACMASRRGDYPRAAALYEEALALADPADSQGRAGTLANLADVAWHQGDRERAAALRDQCLALFRQLDDQDGIAQCLLLGSTMALAEGQSEQAATLGAEALALYLTEGYQVGVAGAWYQLGRVARDQAEYERAAACYREGLALYQALHSMVELAECVEGYASVAAARGRAREAVRLYGAAAALRAALGAPCRPGDRDAIEREVAALRTALGAAFTATWVAGGALSPEQACAEAMRDEGGDEDLTILVATSGLL